MNYVYLNGNTQYRIINTYIYDSHLKVGESLKCACTLGLQSDFLLRRIKPDTGKLYENISKSHCHCFVVCKAVSQKGAVHEI